MTEKKENQPLFLINGITSTNKTSSNKHVYKTGSGGDSYKAYVIETTSIYQIKSDVGKYHNDVKNVIEVAAGFNHYIFLTEDGKVYGIGSSTSGELGKNTSISMEQYGEFNFFKNKNLKVRRIHAGVFQSYFITTDNKYYACGANETHQLGKMSISASQSVPLLITEKDVENVWSGNYAYSVYYKELESGKIIGCGQSVPSNPYILTEDSQFVDKEVVHIEGGASGFLFLALTKEGTSQVYVSSGKNRPKLWSALSGMKVNNFGLNCHNCVLTTEDNKVLASNSTGNTFTEIKNLPEIPQSQRWELVCHAWDTLIFPVDITKNTLYEDLNNVYENQILVDCQLPKTNRKAHKTWIECRFKNTFQEIEKLFQETDSETCQELIDWAYGLITGNSLSQNSVSFLNTIKIDPETPLQDELRGLYLDEDSKNFYIHVKIEDENEDEEDENDQDEDQDEDEIEEIPVHKFVLLLKSGLFREMFQNITEESNNVKDYSEKALESIEIFIKYLYTNTLELTADDDPQIVVEDLENTIEYYKLNEKSNLTTEIARIKKQFDLK
ncbi:btk-binding protein-related [Anaeramoeba flamelloides]|uniref:Btk-binding protein-related n=1 Tax=Anaeramoeba flamelloides TaxID=1746091 RepID=A0ABQ8X580_9EUKA|nr:btk-binding protein-related [Anaeramoeba flamelloides]